MVARSLIKRDGVPRSPSPARLQRFGPVAYRLISRRGDTVRQSVFMRSSSGDPYSAVFEQLRGKKDDGKFRASLRDSSLRRTREMAPNLDDSMPQGGGRDQAFPRFRSRSPPGPFVSSPPPCPVLMRVAKHATSS